MNYKGYKIEIEQDEVPGSPREWDNLGKMVMFHNNYDLGDYTDLKSSDFNNWEEIKEHLIKHCNVAVILPVYMYDHSGLTISTSPFSCKWDSGQIGFIYMTKKTAIEEFGKKILTKTVKQKVLEHLQNEVETYDCYLKGDVVGYKIYKNGEELSSCWGYYGEDICIEDAKCVVDSHVNK